MSSIKPRKRPYRQLIAEEPSGTILLTQSGNTEHTQGSDDAMSIAMSASCAYDVLPHSSPKCYECISCHLKRSRHCPVCDKELNCTDPAVFPNHAAADIVDTIRAESKLGDVLSGMAGNDEANKELAKMAMHLDADGIERLMLILRRRHQQLCLNSTRRLNLLCREFIEGLIEKREQRLRDTQWELRVLRKDKALIDELLMHDNSTPVIRPEHTHQMVPEAGHQSRNVVQNLPEVHSSHPLASSTSSILREVDDIGKYRVRVQQHASSLEEIYLKKRVRNAGIDKSIGPCCDFDDFAKVMQRMAQYGGFKRISSLNYNTNDMQNPQAIVSSIEFDREGELFVLAGVTKRIKLYDFKGLFKSPKAVAYPVMQLNCNAKISNVSWNQYTRHLLANSDYDGVVQLWDTNTAKPMQRYHEHEKRCWTVQFNNVDPHLMASGSDDGKVKLWSLQCERSVATIDVKVNVCCVYFSPTNRHNLAFGSADHCAHIYDVRNPKKALNILRGHRKAVSYVRYLSENELVTASTDSNLRVWDVNTGKCQRIMQGHANERNFVGMATGGTDYVLCGSETNQIYLYYKELAAPILSYSFEKPEGIRSSPVLQTAGETDFISSVCWKKNSNVILAANSRGVTHVLELI